MLGRMMFLIHLYSLKFNQFSQWIRYLDTAGLKKSNAYLINGVVIFFAWMVSITNIFSIVYNHANLPIHDLFLLNWPLKC